MTVDESTEEIASTDPILGPTTSKRSAKTVIVAKDQETVVIGGLMQDRVIKSSRTRPRSWATFRSWAGCSATTPPPSRR
jgi:type II secretory pathway component GspD/PulD (secretin)